MTKILVGRNEKNEFEVGVTVPTAIHNEENEENADGQAQEELAEEAVEDEQMSAPESGDVPEAEKAAPKRRGKKRGKA